MTPELAALRWLLLSEPLFAQHAPEALGYPRVRVQRFSTADLEAISVWLDRLDEAHLHAALSPARAQAARNFGGQWRLGRLAEALLGYFLHNGPMHRLHAAHVPIRRDGGTVADHTTLGELDFLLHSPRGEPQHWELAVKYFLCHAPAGAVATPADFIGPDGRETFERKIHKLMGRQLAHAVPAPHSTQEWQRQVFARGWMFYRHGEPLPQVPWLSSEHLRGTWLSFDAIHTLNPAHRYAVLPRSAWMPALQSAEPLGVHLADLPQVLLQQWQRPAAAQEPGLPPRLARAKAQAAQPSAQLVVALAAEGTHWQEVARHFVMPLVIPPQK